MHLDGKGAYEDTLFAECEAKFSHFDNAIKDAAANEQQSLRPVQQYVRLFPCFTTTFTSHRQELRLSHRHLLQSKNYLGQHVVVLKTVTVLLLKFRHPLTRGNSKIL